MTVRTVLIATIAALVVWLTPATSTAADYSPPEWLPLRVSVTVGCVYSNCDDGTYHGYWAVDFLGGLNQPIHAAGAGIAHIGGTYGGCDGTSIPGQSGGRWVWIDHGSGVVSRYLHMNEILVSEGQQVYPSTQIGRMGSTGFNIPCPAYHLHFEKLTGGVNGTPVDPGPLKACHGSALVEYGNWNESSGAAVHSDGTGCSAPPVDTDGDGLPDSTDQCATQPGPEPNAGCPMDDTAAYFESDFDGDGRPDLAIATPASAGQNLQVLRNQGGSFSAPALWGSQPDYGARDVRLLSGDFDGDGRADVGLVTPRSSGLNVQVGRSTGSSFLPATLWATVDSYSVRDIQVYAGDFTADGRTDVGIVTPRGAAGLNLQVLVSTGSGFAAPALWAATSDYSNADTKLYTGDFDGDGRTDLGLLTRRGTVGVNFQVLLSTGSSFRGPSLWAATDDYALSDVRVVGGDFNGDGRGDVGITTPRGAMGLNVQVLVSSGAGFAAPALWGQTDGYTNPGTRLFGGDFESNHVSDLGLVTPRGAQGLNFQVMPSTASSLGPGALWSATDSYDVATTTVMGSGPDHAAPPTKPATVTLTATRPATGALRVSFDPGDDGGRPVTEFTIGCTSTDGGRTGSVSGPSSPITVAGLTGGKTYRCRGRATNTVGTSGWSAWGSTVVVPVGKPAAPTVTSTLPGAGSVQVGFTPGPDGGSAVTAYTASCVSTDGGAAGTASGTAKKLKVTALSVGKSYKCRVRATNAVGDGPWSAYGATVVVPATAPAAPEVTATTAQAGAARVEFTAAANGGSPVTAYTAECRSTNRGVTGTASGTTRRLTVSGLTAGKSYHCRVRATNAVGDSPWSAYGATVVVL